jgi:predicted nuclease of restriction endonuclease-like RecB superfamily
MLPSNLLRARISGGRIRPVFVGLDADAVALAERITGIYRDGVGKRKGELLERLKEVENEGHDFKLVRGLSTLLERRCVFEAESELNPVEARKAVFREASIVKASSQEDRRRVLRKVSAELATSPEALEKTLFCDMEEELIMRDFKPLPNDTLLKYYNLSVTQTLLFKSLRVEFSASGNWKNIFREVKRLGLIYSVERGDGVGGEQGQGQFKVSLDGPLSLFKMTERYGTSIAKLLPQITASDSWTIKAEILARSRGGKIYNFEADSKELKDLITNVGRGGGDVIGEDSNRPQVGPMYDSTTEEKFARSFLSYGTGWALRREPEPLVAGIHVLIPDFSFEKDGMKVYLEVVGFWTPEYLGRKIGKLNSIASGIDMIIAADESLACSKLERLKGKARVIYYKREVPMKPIVEHLREREASIVSEQVERLKSGEAITLKGDVVDIEEIADQRGATVASIRIALEDFKPEGYVKVGDRFISTAKLDEIDEKLDGVERLVDALGIIEASGVKDEGSRILETLGYTSTWEGMEMDKVRISKTAASKTAAATSSNEAI